ncbi:uncharacterized protein DS421_13g411940 [Arachis hypogaea]|nr:uncharacterized protein DS421_13g411940 [Arachis hypogaea]
MPITLIFENETLTLKTLTRYRFPSEAAAAAASPFLPPKTKSTHTKQGSGTFERAEGKRGGFTHAAIVHCNSPRAADRAPVQPRTIGAVARESGTEERVGPRVMAVAGLGAAVPSSPLRPRRVAAFALPTSPLEPPRGCRRRREAGLAAVKGHRPSSTITEDPSPKLLGSPYATVVSPELSWGFATHLDSALFWVSVVAIVLAAEKPRCRHLCCRKQPLRVYRELPSFWSPAVKLVLPESTIGAAATWFPRVRVVEIVAKVAWNRGALSENYSLLLELLHMDTDVRYGVFGDCICLMYYLIDSNDYGCWFG